MMDIFGDTIFFKSNPDVFIKERYGKKPNTVRQLDGGEWVELNNSMKSLKRITIINNDTFEQFTRKLTDIHQHYIENNHIDVEVWVFSWRSVRVIDDCIE
jgi:hypothetical protein